MSSVNQDLRIALVDWLHEQVPASMFQRFRRVEPITHPSAGDKLIGWWVETSGWSPAVYLHTVLVAYMKAGRIDPERHSLLLEPWGDGYRVVMMATSPRAPAHILPMGVIEAEGR